MAGNSVYFDGLQSVTFSLNEQSVTDTLSYTTADNYAKINDAVNGDYYNYHFRFKVADFEKKAIYKLVIVWLILMNCYIVNSIIL